MRGNEPIDDVLMFDDVAIIQILDDVAVNIREQDDNQSNDGDDPNDGDSNR